MNQITTFICRTRIYHGLGTAAMTGTEAARLGIKKAFLVTDAGIRKAGLLEPIEASLRDSGVPYQVFDSVPEDATTDIMSEGVKSVAQAGADGIVAVGGGSPMCAGKGIAISATNGISVREMEGRNRYRVPPLPVICIPTTAGSGAEVSTNIAIHDSQTERIYGVGGDEIQPLVALLDPLMLRTCPPRQMVYSGLDALSHCLETLWTTKANPLSNSLAYEAIRLIMTNLPKAAFSDDIEAKSNQLLASAMANLALTASSLGIVHAMTMDYHLRVPHGLSNGLLLPYAMEYNLPVCEDRFAQMAIVLGEDPQGLTRNELARLALRRLKELYVTLGVPRKFEKRDIPRDRIPAMAEQTATNLFFAKDNLRKVTKEDAVRLFEASLEGWELD
ncbi:MAG: iron-containing alcohol dehydrogenase [Dehalococcoidia bacterium]|nr:iron-containing alcohol dehydrogenase [Dehalococcoidia bacterium]